MTTLLPATLLPVALVRPEAERLAREFYAALPVGSPQNAYRKDYRDWPGRDYTRATLWDEQTEKWRARLVDAHVTLLRDMSRPASRDWAARELARLVGLECSATAPGWRVRDPRTLREWVLSGSGCSRIFIAEGPTEHSHEYVVPGLDALTYPAESLCAALVAVSATLRIDTPDNTQAQAEPEGEADE